MSVCPGYILCKIIVMKIRDLKHSLQQPIFYFCSHFLNMSDGGYIWAETCSELYLINKGCICTMYIILQVI